MTMAISILFPIPISIPIPIPIPFAVSVVVFAVTVVVSVFAIAPLFAIALRPFSLRLFSRKRLFEIVKTIHCTGMQALWNGKVSKRQMELLRQD